MPLGKALLILGLALAAVGSVLMWAPWLLNWFGRLPGDIRYERDGVGFYFPVVSMIVVSIVLSVLMNVCVRR
jgi:hypothetical protein